MEGQPITVLFARNNPKRSAVYEFGGYRIEGGARRFLEKS
jgi:hypothetical protein